MKKLLFILLISIFSISLKAQIEVTSDNEYGKIEDFEDGSYERLLKTTTIFVFSNVHEKSFYEKILKTSWSLTPYEIIDYKEFDPLNYLEEKYSFCILQAVKNESLFHSYQHLYMYDMAKINKKFGKVKWEKLDKRQTKGKKITISIGNQISFGKIYFYAKAELFKNLPPFSGMQYGSTKNLGYNAAQMKSVSHVFPDGVYLWYMGYSKQDEKIEHLKNMHYSFYNEDVHYNYEKGILTNYLQQFNKQLKNKEYSTRYDGEATKELANLKTATLYIPEYVQISYDGWKIKDSKMSSTDIAKMMSGYKYNYEWITANNLNAKISDGEEFYYLNYSRITATQLFQIVNAKTGEPIYKKKVVDLKYNIGAKNLEKLSKEIAK